MKKTATVALVVLAFILFSEVIETWEKQYDGGFSDSGEKIIKLNDGNFLVGGFKFIENNNKHIWLLKVNADGDTLWTQSWGSETDYVDDELFCMDENSNSDLFLGTHNSVMGIGNTAYMKKTNSSCDTIWQKVFLQESPAFGVWISSMTSTPDSGCIISRGKQISFSGSYGYVEKFDKDGVSTNLLSLSNFIDDSTQSSSNTLRSIISLEDGKYLAIGSKQAYENPNSYIVKLDSALNILWEKVYLEDDFSFTNIVPTLDNNYLIIDGENLIKIRPSGNELWRTNFGDRIAARNVVISLDSNYVVGAGGNIFKLDQDGNILWTRDYGCYDLVATNDGGFLAVGRKNSNVWIYKMDELGNYTSINNEQLAIDNFELEQNYPNPFNPNTEIKFSVAQDNSQIKLIVYNVSGQAVSTLFDGVKNIGRHTANFNASNLNSGVYYYTLEVNGVNEATKRMVMIK